MKLKRNYDWIPFAVLMIFLIISSVLVDNLYPKSLIGIESLKAFRTYLTVQLIQRALGSFLLIFSAVYYIFGREALFSSNKNNTPSDKKARKILWTVITTISVSLFVFIGSRNNIDIQSRKNDYCEFPPVETISLIIDISRDISDMETYTTKADSCSVRKETYSYSYNSVRRGRQTVNVTEYALTGTNGTTISQISFNDYNTLKDKFRQYVPHTIELYKNSGLIASIDGENHNFKTDIMEYVKLSYSNGKFIRTVHKNESEFRCLTFMVELNGEVIAGINAREKTEFSFTLQKGMKAYIAMADTGKYECISNVIEY